MAQNNNLIAGVELGGTKTIALIARGTDILDEFRIPTASPNEVLSEISKWLRMAHEKTPFASIGIASFGPICLDKKAENYGYITSTPKPNWSNIDVVGAFSKWFDGPIGFDTDVNAAALAESFWGATIGCETSVYLTIGTGFGGGIISNGKPMHGFMHPEMGHLRIRRTHQLDFAGNCPFHGDCAEGLLSGPAIFARIGRSAEALQQDDPIWDIIADEIAEFTTSLILTISPNKILFGGGVMQDKDFLLQKVRQHSLQKLNNYISNLDMAKMVEMIQSPALGNKAGPMGAIALGDVLLK